MILSNSDLQSLFLASQAYASRPFCVSTDSSYLHDAGMAMRYVAEELMRLRGVVEMQRRVVGELEAENKRLRLVIRDLEAMNAAGAP